MPGEGYLPPIVATVTGTDSDFVSMIREDIALLKEFGAMKAEPQVALDTAKFLEQIAEVKSLLESLPDGTIRFEDNIPAEMAKIAALKAQISDLQGIINLTTVGGESASGVGVKASAGAGGGGGATGLLAALGWGSGKGLFGILGGMASLGSIASLAGFGAEHVVTSGVGIAGSLAGAGLGAGLLGLGSMGVMGVGMGTDMAGIGQAIGDTQKYTQAQDALNRAIFLYGQNSVQAKAAQYDLNQVMEGWLPVTTQAIQKTSAMAAQFHMLFDQMTGQAEATGADILTQTMQVGEKFLPIIGSYAAQNMKIIQSDIQPLFSWLDNSSRWGGLGIFTNLEQIFQAQLPTAIHAATQGFELFAKVVDIAAQYTGGFIKSADRIFTKLNSPGELSTLQRVIGNLIGLFHSWLDMALSVGKVIYELFRPAVGFGKAFADEIRAIMDQLAKFLALSSTQSALHSLFSAHLNEVVKGLLGILQALLPVLEGGLVAFTQIAALLSGGVAIALRLVASGLHLLLGNPVGQTIGKWAVAFLLLRANMALVGPLIGTTEGELNRLQAILAFVGKNTGLHALVSFLRGAFTSAWGYVSAAVASYVAEARAAEGSTLINLFTGLKNLLIDLATGPLVMLGSGLSKMWAAFSTFTAAIDINKAATMALGAAYLSIAGVGLFLLIQHLGVLHGLMVAGAIAATALAAAWWLVNASIIAFDALPPVALIVAIGLAVAGLVAGIIWLATNWSRAWSDIKQWTSDAVNWVKDHLYFLIPILGLPVTAVLWLAANWSKAWNDMKAIVSTVVHIGSDVINGLVHGIESAASAVIKPIENVGKGILRTLRTVLGVFSPSVITQQIGADTTTGLGLGITQTSAQAVGAAKTVANQIIAAFGSLSHAKAVEGAVGTLAGVFQKLATVFSDFGKAASGAAGIKTTLPQISGALSLMAKNMPNVVTQINSVDKSFAKISNSKELGQLPNTIGNVSKVFGALGTAAKDSAQVTAPALQNILTSLNALVSESPDIELSITTIVTSFHSLDSSKSAMSSLQGLTSLMNDLSQMFNSLASTSKASSAVTSQSLSNILTSLNALVAAAPDIELSVTTIKGEFDKMGNLQAVNSQLSSLDQMFSSLSSVFNDLGSAAQAAAGVTPQALTQITTAIQQLATQLQQIPKAITDLQPTAVTDMQNLMSALVVAINSQDSAFTTAGVNLMVGLEGGIRSMAGAVAAQASAAASGAVAAAKAATQTHSPSVVFTQMGMDWMQGLINGMVALAGQVATTAQNTALQAVDQILQDLRSIFSDVVSVGQAAGALTDQAFQQMYAGMSLVTNEAPQLEQAINNLEPALAAIGSTTPNVATNLTSLDQVIQPLGQLFGDITTAATNAGTLTDQAFQQMYTGMGLVADNAGQLEQAINNLEPALAAIGSTTPNVATNVTSLEQVIQPLAQLLGDIGTAATNAASLTDSSINQMITGMNLLASSAPSIEAAMTTLATSLSGYGSNAPLAQNLTDLDQVFQPLGTLFQDLGSAANNAGLLTVQGVQNIGSGIEQLANLLPSLQGPLTQLAGVFGAMPASVSGSSLTNLGTNLSTLEGIFSSITTLFSDMQSATSGAASVTPDALNRITTAVGNMITAAQNLLSSAAPNFQTLGANLMDALAQGISMGVAAAIKAVHDAVAQVELSASTAIAGGTPKIPYSASGSGAGGNTMSYNPTYHVTITAPSGNAPQISSSVKSAITDLNNQVLDRLLAGNINSAS
ncbi:MAG: hypothetical protein KGL39_04345 [Patescibacteria group bacterium]|nr:hypothetical protein [Patescibacteria group bacterium]